MAEHNDSEQSRDQPWLANTVRQLDESARDLDAATLSRLNRARQAALSEVRRKRSAWSMWLPGLVVAMGLTLAVGLLLRPGVTPTVPFVDPAQDFAMLSEADDLDMYEDLEFYAWLDAQPSSDGSFSDWDQDS